MCGSPGVSNLELEVLCRAVGVTRGKLGPSTKGSTFAELTFIRPPPPGQAKPWSHDRRVCRPVQEGTGWSPMRTPPQRSSHTPFRSGRLRAADVSAQHRVAGRGRASVPPPPLVIPPPLGGTVTAPKSIGNTRRRRRFFFSTLELGLGPPPRPHGGGPA